MRALAFLTAAALLLAGTTATFACTHQTAAKRGAVIASEEAGYPQSQPAATDATKG
jgi:hypothetical protein